MLPDSRPPPDPLPPGPAPSVRRWRRLVEALAPWIFFAVLTAVVAWPLLNRLDSAIAGSDQDAYINPWADMWTLLALRDPQRTLWFTDLLFYPHGANLHYHSFSHLTSTVSLALRPLVGALPAYNLTILLHLVLAGVSMFHLARYLTASSAAALLAGIVFAFNTHNIWQTGHPVLVSVWPVPWSALFLLRALERHDARLALVAAGVVLLAALCSTLMLILTALWLGFILFLAVISGRLARAALPTLALFAAATTLLAAVPLLPLLGETVLSRDTSFVVQTGAVVPADVMAPLQPIWLGLLGRSLHFGLIPLVLLITAILCWRKCWPWFLLLLLTYIFAIGPEPLISGDPQTFSLPWSDLVQPLLRHTHRLNVLLSAALAVLVAYGYRALSTRLIGRRLPRWPLALLLAALIFAEYTMPPFPYTTPRVSSFYTGYLQAVPDDVALAILPTGRQQDKLYMYYQTLHGHPITGGVISRPRQDVFQFIRSNPLLRAAAVNWPAAPLPGDVSPALDELARSGVGFVVLEKELFQRHRLPLHAWREAMPVSPVYEDELVVVYRTAPSTAAETQP